MTLSILIITENKYGTDFKETEEKKWIINMDLLVIA